MMSVWPCGASHENAKFLSVMREASHQPAGVSETQTVLNGIGAAAADLGIAASTLGRMAGQGGGVQVRLLAGNRVWPETAERMRDAIAQIKASSGATR